MARGRFYTGFGKFIAYARVAAHVALVFAGRPRDFGWSPIAYFRFLRRASLFLRAFWPNKVVRVHNGLKLHLYLPAWPSPAFFRAVRTKFIAEPPGPISVLVSTTRACTFKCSHCYQQKDGGADLDLASLESTVRRLLETGVAFFNVEGGEPFLKFDRLEAVLKALDSRAEVWVNTTGAHMTPQKLEALVESGLEGLMVSVHSPDRATHDSFTGVPGSFDMACEAARACKRMDRAVALNSVLSEEELRGGGLERLMELARSLGADYVQLIHPKPAGGWMGRTESMQRDLSSIAAAGAAHREYNSAARADYPSLSAQAFEESPGMLGCTAGGIDRFYVNASGEVQPCEFLNLSFGNVREEPFETIFARMRSVFSVPCSDWPCCTQAEGIAALIRDGGVERTPVPYAEARGFLETMRRGDATRLYERMGIYR